MKQYEVLGTETVAVTYIVEANSPEEAMQRARDGFWEHESDGDVLDIRVEEARERT